MKTQDSPENWREDGSQVTWDLLREIDAAFTGLDRLGKSIQEIRGGDRRTITIAAPNAFSMRLLPLVVKRLLSETSIQRVHIRSGTYQEVADHVHQGRADIGISRLPVDQRRLDYTPVAKAVNVCMFAAGHRFTELDLIKPENLFGESLVDIDPQFSSHQMNVNAMRFSGADPEIAVEYDAYGHDAGFVAAGVGVSITNEILAWEYCHFHLEVRRFEPSATYHYVILREKDRELSNELRKAIEVIASHLEI